MSQSSLTGHQFYSHSSSIVSGPSFDGNQVDENAAFRMRFVVRQVLKKAIVARPAISDRLSRRILMLLDEPIEVYSRRTTRDQERIIEKISKELLPALDRGQSSRRVSARETQMAEMTQTLKE